jgi:hypothetical protein
MRRFLSNAKVSAGDDVITICHDVINDVGAKINAAAFTRG